MPASVRAAHSSVAVGVGEGLCVTNVALGDAVALVALVALGTVAAGGALHAASRHARTARSARPVMRCGRTRASRGPRAVRLEDDLRALSEGMPQSCRMHRARDGDERVMTVRTQAASIDA
jgi:hypothetical protein